MKYILDTAVWINGVTMPDVLPPRIRKLVDTDRAKGLASVSLLETAILHRLGRLEFDGSLEDLFAAGLSSDLKLIELTPTVAIGTNALPRNFPGDPFDRTIVATASAFGFTLITADPAIRAAQACAVAYYDFKPSGR